MGQASGLESTSAETNRLALRWALENGEAADAVGARFNQLVRGNNAEADRAKTIIRGYFGKTAFDAFGVNPPPQNAMARLVAGRSLALVGPQSLRDHDVKNASGASAMGIVNPFEGQLDMLQPKENWVGYFSNGFTQKSPEAPKVCKRWKMAMASHKSEDIMLAESGASYERRVMFQHPFSSGTRLMLQASIFDLLQFYPNSVSVYGSDLYLSAQTHSSGYLPDQRRQAKGRFLFFEHEMGTAGFMHHDLFSNFSYTALLQERGLITLSGPLSEALGSGIMFYATQLEETHIGPFIS